MANIVKTSEIISSLLDYFAASAIKKGAGVGSLGSLESLKPLKTLETLKTSRQLSKSTLRSP